MIALSPFPCPAAAAIEAEVATPVAVGDESRQGVQGRAEEILRASLREGGYGEMMVVSRIAFSARAGERGGAVTGEAHVAYLPAGRVVGARAVGRLVRLLARRLRRQERWTVRVRDVIGEVLQPHGVAVVVEARHVGRATAGAVVTTRAVSGGFEDPAIRAEFLLLIRRGAAAR